MTHNKGYTFLVKILFIVCLLLYNFQGTLLPLGSNVCRAAVSVVMVVEIICFLMSINKISFPIFITLFLIIILTFSAFALSDPYVNLENGGVVHSSSELLAITYVCLFVFAGYQLYKNDIFIDRDVVILLLALLVQSIISFFYTRNRWISEWGYTLTNNIGYAFASLFPCVFFFKRKTYQWIIIITIYVFVLLCAKRGAIIVSSLFILYFMLCNIQKSKHIIASTFAALITITLVAVLTYWIYSGNEYLQKRMELTLEGDSSHRNVIYSTLINSYLDFDNIFHYLFGKGLLTSVKHAGRLAHNDWIEFLLSNGLLGVSVYFLFFVQLLKYTRKKSISTKNKRIIISIFIIWFTKSFFSMAISDVMFAPIPLVLGMVIARDEKETQLFNTGHYASVV